MHIPVVVHPVWAEWIINPSVLYDKKAFHFVKGFFNVVNLKLWKCGEVEMEFVNDYQKIENLNTRLSVYCCAKSF